MEEIRGYYNSLADALEVAPLDDHNNAHKEVRATIMPGKNAFPGVVNDVYIALEGDSIHFGSPDIDLSMLFSGSSIVGSPEPDYLGADAEDLRDDGFVSAIYKEV